MSSHGQLTRRGAQDLLDGSRYGNYEQLTELLAAASGPARVGELAGLERAYAHFKARGHHLYVFLPDLSTFYGPGEDPAFQYALDWAAEEDRARLHHVLGELRADAVPTYVFDRRGAGTKVISAYGQMRAWGGA